MKKPKLTRILLTTLLSIWLLPGLTAADDTTAGVEEKKPLGNRELHQLRMELGSGDEMVKEIKGTEVKVRVVIHIRQDQTVWCTVLKPDKERWRFCAAHLSSLTPNFSAGLKDGEEYLLEGMIEKDEICYGAFWVRVNKLTARHQE